MKFPFGTRVRHIFGGAVGTVVGAAEYQFETPSALVDFGTNGADGRPSGAVWISEGLLEEWTDDPGTAPENLEPPSYACIVVDDYEQAKRFRENLEADMGDSVHGGDVTLGDILKGDLSGLAPDEEIIPGGRLLRWRVSESMSMVLRILGYSDPDGLVTEKAKATGTV